MRGLVWVLGGFLGAASLGVAQEPVRISGGVMAAQVLTKVEPVYPAIAQAAGVSGAVVLHTTVGADGLVKNLEVIAGPEMLRGAAVEAVRQWTYKPYLLNGEPRAVDTTVTVRFEAGNSGAGAGAAPEGGAMDGDVAPRPHTEMTATRGVARIAGGVMAGQILTKVNPVYPPEAKAKGISGMVVMRATIAKGGAIENLTVLSGPEELRGSAMEAVSQWTYRPYLLNGEPTEVDTTITVNYSFGAGGPPAAQSTAAAGDDLGMFDGPPLEGEAGSERVGGGVMAGMILKKVTPEYPANARANYVSGTVLLHAIIGKDGTITALRVISGPKELQGSAMHAVKQWRYRPYLLKGEPTEVDTTISVNYYLGR